MSWHLRLIKVEVIIIHKMRLCYFYLIRLTWVKDTIAETRTIILFLSWWILLPMERRLFSDNRYLASSIWHYFDREHICIKLMCFMTTSIYYCNCLRGVLLSDLLIVFQIFPALHIHQLMLNICWKLANH